MSSLIALLPLAPLVLCVLTGDRVTGREFATRSEVIAKHGMAATSQPLATQAAVDILRRGGSAVDAAIAANAVLCLVEPTGCGVGGDLFAIVWDAETKELVGLNGSGRSPASLTLEEFERRGLTKIPKYGVLPISVPGAVDGWFSLHGKFGKLPMSEVLAPAVSYAREGAPITELIAHYWALSAKRLGDQPGFPETFLPGGKAPAKGDLFQNPGLADLLETLGRDGVDAFYRGEIAHRIADFVQASGGFLSFEDLSAHRSEWVAPVSASYRGFELWELPPNGQGIAALQMLNLLEPYDLAKAGFGSADHLHFLVEAKKLAFEDRARSYGDPDFASIPVKRLISKEYAAERAVHIDPKQAMKVGPAPHPSLDQGDTIYLCTADSDGNMVSLIQSNYRGMGSGVCPTGLGFGLQDRGELFDLTPGRVNSYAPKKRPFHTIIPAFVTHSGAPYMAFGVMGGATQPQAHVQILLNMIDFGMNLQEAGDAPRVVHTGSSQPTGERMDDGGEVCVESGFPMESLRELARRKHKIVREVGLYGGYQAVLWDAERGVWFGASESRKDGQAAGY